MEQIQDNDELYRRLAPLQINDDGSVNSSAFKRGQAYDTGISLDLARLTTPEESVQRAGRAGFRSGVIQAGAARALGFAVRHDPVPSNHSHCLIEGENDRQRSRALARLTRVVAGVQSQDP